MNLKLFSCLSLLAALASASAVIPKAVPAHGPLDERAGYPTKPCKHGPHSRSCWGKYSTKTDYYEETPNTGVVHEYHWEVQNITLSPDGFAQPLMVVNGQFPGPTINVNWGDEVIVHVKNSLEYNGTAIHWHGVRMLGTSEHDGVPGVTQCPIAPGDTYTYKWRAVQYGTSWWHAHLSFQHSMGLFGAIVVNGPATADYDEDLGPLYIQDWNHIDPWNEWWWMRGLNDGPPAQKNSLINGTNVFDCKANGYDPKTCFNNGTRFEMNFERGKKYRLRVINVGLYSHFRFAIDGHKLKVIQTDFVPIVPYETDNIVITMGQRYDLIIEANAKPDDYWIRPIWQRSCADNEAWNNTLGIVRYNKRSKKLPKTTHPAIHYPYNCVDEPFNKIVPYVRRDVPAPPSFIPPLNIYFEFVPLPAGFLFTLNMSYVWINFSAPANLLLDQGADPEHWPQKFTPHKPGQGFTSYNAYPFALRDKWVFWNVQDISNRNRSHPMHLHGHDFYVLAQGDGKWTSDMPLNLKNPIRRDTATVPINGHMVMAFKTDNPGSWLFHCHIQSHAAQGLGLMFLERPEEIPATLHKKKDDYAACKKWNEYWPKKSPYIQQDSGL